MTGSLSTFSTAVSTIADFQWRFICADLYLAYTTLNPTSSYSPKILKIYQVNKLLKVVTNWFFHLSNFKATINPATPDIYIDVVSVRRLLPIGYDGKNKYLLKWYAYTLSILYLKDGLLSTSRRLYPSLEIAFNKFNLTKTNSTISISILPANCLSNLSPIIFSQSYTVT